jgi:hypothetical protein
MQEAGMSSQEAEPYAYYGPPQSATSESRLEWVLEETTRSRRFLGAMVVGPQGTPIANKGFEQPALVAAMAPEFIRLLGRLKEGLPEPESEAGRPPGEAVSFAGFGEPVGEADVPSPEYTAASLGRDMKLLFRPLDVQGRGMTLVLLTQALSANTDAVLEGIGRAVSTCLVTDWSRSSEG